MGPDSRSDYKEPATPDEQIVAAKILGACTHRFWSEFTNKQRDRVLVCSDCGTEFEFVEDLASWSGKPPEMSPGNFLLRFVPHAAQDELLASTVVRRIEQAGWTPMLRIVPDGFVQLFSRNGVRFVSAVHKTKAAAICDSGAQLCRSGQLSIELI